MRVYQRDTAPVVDHYRRAGTRIERIDGSPPIDRVTAQILRSRPRTLHAAGGGGDRLMRRTR